MINEFNEKSQEHITKFHPMLVAILTEAQVISELDFEVMEGPQSARRQEELWYKGEIAKEGGPDTYGLGCYLSVSIGGIMCMNMSVYTELATAMSYGASNLGHKLFWSGVYTEEGMSDITTIGTESLQSMIEECHKKARAEGWDYVPRLNYFELLPAD